MCLRMFCLWEKWDGILVTTNANNQITEIKKMIDNFKITYYET